MASGGRLQGKLALVTGSTAGIGKAIAAAFVKEGASVIVNSRNQEAVDATVQELKGLIPPTDADRLVSGVAADVTSAAGSHALSEAVSRQGLPLDILVLNTGRWAMGDFFSTSDEQWDEFFQANVMSHVRLSRTFLQPMLQRNAGRVIIVSAEAALRPQASMLPYAATKAAAVNLARGLAELTRGTGVTVNSLMPGTTLTEAMASWMSSEAAQQGCSMEETITKFCKDTQPTNLLQRFLQPEELADAAVFLASNAGVNGLALKMDAGVVHHT